MNQESFSQEDLDTIKDQFSQEYMEGKVPTLTAYIAKYPMFADELTDFIMTFAEIHSSPLEEFPATPELEAAMRRGLAAAQTRARTIADRKAELGLSDIQLANLIRAPIEIFSLFHRNHVLQVPRTFRKVLANALSLSEVQSQRMLAPQALAYRAAKGPKLKPKTFAAILDELKDKNLISDDDYTFWKGQAEAA